MKDSKIFEMLKQATSISDNDVIDFRPCFGLYKDYNIPDMPDAIVIQLKGNGSLIYIPDKDTEGDLIKRKFFKNEQHIYSITEENVDGCGGDAEMFISAPTPLTGEEQQTLNDCLKNAKNKAGDNDTEDMISDALNMFKEKTGKPLRFIGNPVEGYFCF